MPALLCEIADLVKILRALRAEDGPNAERTAECTAATESAYERAAFAAVVATVIAAAVAAWSETKFW